MHNIIDAHTHMSDGLFRGPQDKGFDMGEMLSALDAFGVGRVWISPASGLYANGEFPAANEALFRFCREAGGRMEGFFTVNPNYGEKSVEEVHRCVQQYGFRGLKLHPWLQSFPVSIPAVGRVVEACIGYGIPILFHDGTPPYASTLQIANLAERYPKATILLGHAGLIETYDNAIAAANRMKNLYLCLCGPSIFHLQKIVASVPAEKLLFGTDFGFAPNTAALRYRIKMWDYVELPEQTREQIYWRTAETLLPSR